MKAAVFDQLGIASEYGSVGDLQWEIKTAMMAGADDGFDQGFVGFDDPASFDLGHSRSLTVN